MVLLVLPDRKSSGKFLNPQPAGAINPSHTVCHQGEGMHSAHTKTKNRARNPVKNCTIIEGHSGGEG